MASVLFLGCGNHASVDADGALLTTLRWPLHADQQRAVDVLLVVDNSDSMGARQAQLLGQIDVLLDTLVSPTIPGQLAASSLRVGVLSTDLGTPGTIVPSCANTDRGDDGVLNPIRDGLAMREHPPWDESEAAIRPARCENRSDQYPPFLMHRARESVDTFRDEVVCNAYLGTRGCRHGQPLEALYRAVTRFENLGLVSGPAAFIRDGAVLAVVMLTDHDDQSVRDCRYAERDDPEGDCQPPRGDALAVYDTTATTGPWATADRDLTLRFDRVLPASDQDPFWSLHRYLSLAPRNYQRGLFQPKSWALRHLVFSAIVGVPLRADDGWSALLGTREDSADAFEGTSPEGPVSMRPDRVDAQCPTRVMPACRDEGSLIHVGPVGCDRALQGYARPSRRIAEIARRVHAVTGNGLVSSVCASDYGPALRRTAARVADVFATVCLPRPLLDLEGQPLRVRQCRIIETFTQGEDPAVSCTADRGRHRGETDSYGHPTCIVDAIQVAPGRTPPPDAHGFWYDPEITRNDPTCAAQVRFTRGDDPPLGATMLLDCVLEI